MAGDEPVTSPDQHRPTVNRRMARLGLVVSVFLLVLMIFWGNHQGHVEDIFLGGTAALLVAILIIDFLLRRARLRS